MNGKGTKESGLPSFSQSPTWLPQTLFTVLVLGAGVARVWKAKKIAETARKALSCIVSELSFSV